MVELCIHDQDYLAVCQHYRAMFNTPRVKEDEAVWKEVSGCVVHLLCTLVCVHVYGLKVEQA